MIKKNAFMPQATELEWLIYFYQNADFGPADSEVREWMKQAFVRYAGKRLPTGYESEYEDEY